MDHRPLEASGEQLTITWTAAAKPGSPSRSVIATGTGKFKSSGTIKIKIVLTNAGKRLLRAGHSVQVAGSARLTHAGSPLPDQAVGARSLRVLGR
jgi:hypothetical protein